MTTNQTMKEKQANEAKYRSAYSKACDLINPTCRNMDKQNNSSFINNQEYWTGISILLNNYHAVNRKLFACIIKNVETIKNGLQQFNSENNTKENEIKDKSVLLSQLLELANNKKTDYEGFVVHFKCLPKNGKDSIEAKGIIDFLGASFKMTFQSSLMDDFEIKLVNNDIEINMLTQHLDVESSLRWSEFVLKPKLLKWCRSESFQAELLSDKARIGSSLRLIDLEKYNNLYNEFKQKYSASAKTLWLDAKESTDPLKFIYEDLAIAAYLITLWQSNLVNHPPEAFADLGCGNGLLVYILIHEGYQGYGYDIRSRKLWSLYPPNVTSKLFEQAIEPFKFELPSEVDWIIGNHSDELSPWLPVLAATCHNNMNYFLLPCCAFEFSGNKFQRRNSSVSGYKDFCDYAEKISEICGFKTEKDRLKIPSTKRIALIGLNRQLTQTEFVNKMETIKEFVKNEQQLHPNSTLDEIKLREKTETVRNCTKIDKTIIDDMVKKIFMLLLQARSQSTDNFTVDNTWQSGGLLTMAAIAKNLDKSELKHIKSECGGVKTLLRNKHEIFEFYPPDFVKVRKPIIRVCSSDKPQTIKKRQCFFKQHHPQGCPLTDEECTFVH